jgi:flagellar basal body-associated protein FliL
MADTDSKYKDSFISQDELDRLLAEADRLGPEAFAQSPPAGDPPSGDEDMINQDDIEALLSLADGPADSPASEDNEVITQDDIDALLNTRPAAKPAPPAKGLPIEDDDDLDVGADLDLVTPEDIKNLLRSDAAATASPSTPTSDPDNGSLDTITAEDLMGLSGGQEIKAEAGPLAGDDDALITQEDINAILAGATPAPPPAAESPAEAPPVPEPVPAKAQTPDKEESLISQEDIDSLLAGAGMLTGDESPASAEAEEDNLISQEDIDKLLLGKSDEVEAEAEETLIDQDDIDRLLNAAQPFDDTRLSTAAPEKLISQEDIDKLLSEDLDRGQAQDQEERLADQVILEAEPGGKKSSRTDTGPWYRSRLFVSLAAVGLVLLVSLVSLVLFSGKTEPPLADHDPVPTVDTPAQQDTLDPFESAPAPVAAQDIIRVTMNGFLVPAPANIKGMAYIALDMTLEISDAPSDPIKDYEPFFRNIVYEVINKAFVLQSDARIVEADLKKMIKDALNDALSEGAVSRIDFDGFTAG